MIRLLYWSIAAVLVAIAVHIGLVIFMPRQEMSERLALAAGGSTMNALTVKSDGAREILGYHPGDSVYAFCPFDLQGGQLVFDALMPATLWAITIYSGRGETLYSVNSRQAGVDNFQISVNKAPDFLTQVTSDVDTGEINDGWQVKTSQDKGLIVVWAATSEPFQRSSVAKDLARSRCYLQK
jgi:uncharacterized membrane protein